MKEEGREPPRFMRVFIAIIVFSLILDAMIKC